MSQLDKSTISLPTHSSISKKSLLRNSTRLYNIRSHATAPRISFFVDWQQNSSQSASDDQVTSVQGETQSDVDTTEQLEHPDQLSRFNVSELGYDDVDEVRTLLDDHTLEVYNVTDPFNVIHNCYISYKLTNYSKQIVGVVCMDEYPNVPALPPVGWSHWADHLYNIKDLSSYNALWVHLAAFDRRYKHVFLYPILNNLFHEMMIKQFVLFVIPKGTQEKVAYLNGCSSVILPQGFRDTGSVQSIRLCARQDFITQYKIRRAVEEDNDDLVPLIHKFSPRFVELYGNYYVAEIIARHPEADRKIIVAEHDGEAVSVLCLNPTVNYDQLNDCFDLHVFTGLYKAEGAIQAPRKEEQEEEEEEEETIQEDPASQEDEVIISDSEPKMARAALYNEYMKFMKMDDVTASTHSSVHTGFSILNNLDVFNHDHSSASFILTLNRSHTSEDLVSEESTMESSTSNISELPFIGTKNAFAIEILAAQPNHQPSLSLLIISCFECFPNRDYCLLTIPHDADYTPIMNYFVRIQPKLTSQYPHELYVCHRGQLSAIRIRTATIKDSEMIKAFTNLIKPPNTPGEIVGNFEKGLSGEEPITTFIALSGKHHRYPVGIAQVSKVTDLGAIKAKYAVNQRSDIRWDSDSSFGYLRAFVISPLFKRHMKYFLREVHRKTVFKTLFYAVNQHDAMDYRIRPLSFAMTDMWSVPPRKTRVSLKKPIADYPEEPYALFMSTPKLTSKPVYGVNIFGSQPPTDNLLCRVHINFRIVVVGASETALAFLEKLLTNEVTQCLVSFNNVLMISSDGLSKPSKYEHIRNMLTATHTVWDADYLEKTGLRSKISVLTGSLTAIDRKNKSITVNKEVTVAYNYLFIMTGLHYGPPKKRGAKEYSKIKLPLNCFTINNTADGDNALETLSQLVELQEDRSYQIVIYGHSIDCYCCIAALIEFGIPAKAITLIDPWPRDSDAYTNEFVFQDGGIYETVVRIVEHAGVEIRTGFKLIDWYSRPLSLKFEALTRYLVLTPLCAFLYSNKTVDMRMFTAIHQAGLVFDGRLVIDPDCRTNDKYIYAAGPITKYSRKLWADHLCHSNFNSAEIGGRLGRTIRTSLLPFKEREKIRYAFGKSCWSRSKRMVPYYFKPLVTYCKLPGGLYYLNVGKPGMQIPLETAMSDSDYGSVISTGNCRNLKMQGYFRVHLNIHRMVETITCISMQKFDYRKLVLLWGKHEALLNNLVRRFESMYITDLFEYFQKAWCAAIFLDDFPLLESAIMKVMTSLTSIEGESPIEDLFNLYMENGFKPLAKEQRKVINEKFKDSGYETQIQSLIMEFIRDNLSVLDMYAHPIIVNYILSGFEQSPMFQETK